MVCHFSSVREAVTMGDAVVLYPAIGVSHLIPMVELGKLIVTHHPSLSVIVIIPTTPQDTASTTSYINHVSSTTAPAAITFHHLPTVTLPPSNAPSLFEEVIFQVPRLNNSNVHQALQSLSQKFTLRAFVIDFFCNAAAQVSTSLNIPTYYFYISSGCGLAVFLHFPAIHKTTTTSIKDFTTTHVEFPGVPPIPVSDIPKPWLDRNTDVYNNFLNTSIQMPKSLGIIVNSVECLHPRAVKAISDGLSTTDVPAPPVYCVGPLISGISGGGDRDHECLRWLDLQPSRSVVFLCFGSRGLFKAEQLKEMAIGLVSSDHRFLWVVRNPPPPEPDLDAILPEGFVDRISDRGLLVVNSWCPQVAVLSHDSVGGFVTHCGWSSVLESVSGGVPMLAWPLYAEQRLNRVFLVEEMKVALGLEGSGGGFVRAAELEKRVKELMDSENGKAVREKVRVMREGVKAAMGEGGSSRVALAKLAELWKRG